MVSEGDFVSFDGLSGEVERELKHQRKQEAVARHEARLEACWAALRADPGLLADEPPTDPWRTGETLRAEVLRLLFRGTRATRSKAFEIVEAALARRAVAAAP